MGIWSPSTRSLDWRRFNYEPDLTQELSVARFCGWEQEPGSGSGSGSALSAGDVRQVTYPLGASISLSVTPCSSCSRIEVLGRHSLCWPSYSPCNYPFCSSSLNIRHSSAGKRVPWALLRGGPRAELASLTAPFSSFSSPCHPRSCPSSRGGSQRPGDGICIVLGRFPGELWAPLPSWVPAICLLLGLFWQSSPKTLAVEAWAHRIAPLPKGPLEPGAAAFSSQHPVGLQSPPSLTAGSGSGTVPLGGLSVGISCYFRQWWRSRTWPCPSSWRNGDVRTWLGGISIGTPGRRIMGTWFPRVRRVQDYLW